MSHLCVLASLTATGFAANLNWDPDGDPTNGIGGSGTWDLTTLSCDDDGLAPNIVWNNATLDTAVFAGTSGAITLGTGSTVGGLIFNLKPPLRGPRSMSDPKNGNWDLKPNAAIGGSLDVQSSELNGSN